MLFSSLCLFLCWEWLGRGGVGGLLGGRSGAEQSTVDEEEAVMESERRVSAATDGEDR